MQNGPPFESGAPGSPSRPSYSDGRDALLDATQRVIAREGLRGLTYRRVAAEAGVTHGLVGYHFGSREKLIHEALRRALLEAVAGSSIDPASGLLDDFAADLPALVEESPDAQAFQFEIALEARRREDMGQDARALYDEYYSVIEGALKRIGVDVSPAMARLVFAALDGITLQQLIFGERDRSEQMIEALHELLRLLAR